MPTRSRRAAAAATTSTSTIANEPDVNGSPSSPAPIHEASSLPPTQTASGDPVLLFGESLTWRAGRPTAVGELLRRLQALGDELKDLDQYVSDGPRDSFNRVAKELADPQLLTHKDRGVRAWTALCLVEVMRICAPYAPFVERQIKAIFEMIVKSIFPALATPSSAYHPQHMHVLQSLAEVKSVVIMADYPACSGLTVLTFSTFFDAMSSQTSSTGGEQLTRSISNYMIGIMEALIQDGSILPQEAVDIVMAQFLRTDPRVTEPDTRKTPVSGGKQTTLSMRELPPAYYAAKTVCNSCADRMAREASKYFSDVIVEAVGSKQRTTADMDDFEPNDAGPTEQDYKELDKAHRLLRELWRACPPILQDVIPQLEQELSAENMQLRALATETLGDMISGIGAAGLAQNLPMNPFAYPPEDLASATDFRFASDPLRAPSTSVSFMRAHAHAYGAFRGRRQDKAPLVRAVWATAIGHILSTSAGGMGLSHEDERELVNDMARMLNDSDDKVRLAAVGAVGSLSLRDVLDKLGVSGSVDDVGSVLGNLGERIKDRKHAVRHEAMNVFARIWGAAAGEIARGNDRLREVVGGIPSKILNTYYTNDPEIILFMDSVLFEVLLPLGYPPIKNKTSASKTARPGGEDVADATGAVDPAKIRVERILTLVNGLDARAKKIFYALSARQVSFSKYMRAYITACEAYNGGVSQGKTHDSKERLSKIIVELSKLLPDSHKVGADLWKFAKLNDRRSYAMINYCMAQERDYRTVFNALKEVRKRIENSSSPSVADTIIPMLYRVGVFLYNKSHIPPILEISRTDEKGLAGSANELLTDISQRTPEVLKLQVRDICVHLQSMAPTASKGNTADALELLRTCAAFARKFPQEIPQDRAFTDAMTGFVMHGSPSQTAKYAVAVLLATPDKTRSLAGRLARQCMQKFEYGKAGFTSRLAALSQLWLLAPAELDREADELIDIAVSKVLLPVRSPSKADADAYTWSATADDECQAKLWAIKILANRVRSHTDVDTLADVAKPVYDFLNTLIAGEGELSASKKTPPEHKSRLRLQAARALLKLSCSKSHDALLTPLAFNKLAEVAQDPLEEVRFGFLSRLKKYLGRNALSPRFYAIPFLLANEPSVSLKNDTITWLRSRAAFFAEHSHAKPTPHGMNGTSTTLSRTSTILENTFSRLISLLAHHPDYDDTPEDLVDHAKYLVFYLSIIANANNVSLLFHIAQRVKASRDAVGSGDASTSTDMTRRLHVLSDMALYSARTLIDAHDWSLTSLPTRVALPRSLFAEIRDHDEALAVAETNFLSKDVEQGIEALVRHALRRRGDSTAGARKRKSEKSHGSASIPKRRRAEKHGSSGQGKSRARKRRSNGDEGDDDDDDDDGNEDEEDDNSSLADRATTGRHPTRSARAVSPGSRRRSGRMTGEEHQRSYRERDESEDDAELEDANDAEMQDADDSDE